MTLDEAIEMYTSNAEYERTHGSLQGCMDFRQLAEWLKDYKRLLAQEPSGDWIRQQDVIKVLTKNRVHFCDMVKITSELKELPSVDQEPKTGHWIMSNDDLYRPICNNCGAHPWKGYIPIVEEAAKVFKYCPNCGCAMFELQESKKINCKATKCENCINHNYCDYEPQESEVSNAYSN